MKSFSVLLCALGCCAAMAVDVLGGVVIKQANYGSVGNIYGNINQSNFQGGYDVSDPNKVNQSLADTKSFSFGNQGEYSYSFEVGNSNSVNGSQIQLSTSASINIDAATNSLPSAESYDRTFSYMVITVDQTYLAQLSMTGSALTTPSVQFLEVANAFQTNSLPSSPWVNFEHWTTNLGNGSYETQAGSATFQLNPGEYVFGVSLTGRRFGPYDLQDTALSGITSITLTPVAVPEPTGLVVLGCVGAFGLAKLRRKPRLTALASSIKHD